MLEAFKAGLVGWQPYHFVCDDDSYCHMDVTGVASKRYIEGCKEVTALLFRLITVDQPNDQS